MQILKLALISSTLILSFSAQLSTVANAADSLKPGQWDITMKNDQMKAMPKMSPDQLAQMKKMGIKMPEMSDGGMKVQSCITPEQSSLEKMPQQQDKNCKVQNIKHSGNTVSAETVCTGEMKATGKFEMTMVSDTAYTSKSSIKGVTKDGEPINQTMESSGKWVKAKCDAGVAGYGKQQ